MNGWLSPIELGSFDRDGQTIEIRESLSIQDTARAITGASAPTPRDLIPTVEEYRLVPGDAVNVFIHELRSRGVESAQQAVVDTQGMIDLPVVGWMKASGLTAWELEHKLKDILAERDILYDAEVLVQFAAQRALTYTIFGNESLAVRLNRGPGVFPIPRPDFRLLDALSIAGGLSELVAEIYLFRNPERDEAQAEALRAMRLGGHPAERAKQSPASFNGPGGTQVQPDDAPADETPAEDTPAEDTPAEDAPESDATSDEPDVTEPELSEDVREIIDLMLSDTPRGTSPGTAIAPGDQEQAQPGENSGDDLLPRRSGPSQWIFDVSTGAWIEVSPDQVREIITPRLPEGDNDVVPAIDWEAIASQGRQNRIMRISAEGLRRGEPESNVVVRAGDVIRLYSGDIGFYYMTGHTNRPGVYSFRSGATVTLKNAVAAAGGLDALGWPTRVTVYRRIGDREQMIQVDLDRIYAGLDADFYLKRDDIVNIGTHPVAPFLLQLRNLTIPQLSGTITYNVGYRYTRQETFFRNENLDTPDRPALFP